MTGRARIPPMRPPSMPTAPIWARMTRRMRRLGMPMIFHRAWDRDCAVTVSASVEETMTAMDRPA